MFPDLTFWAQWPRGSGEGPGEGLSSRAASEAALAPAPNRAPFSVPGQQRLRLPAASALPRGLSSHRGQRRPRWREALDKEDLEATPWSTPLTLHPLLPAPNPLPKLINKIK